MGIVMIRADVRTATMLGSRMPYAVSHYTGNRVQDLR
jgi:hypothetical protein